jgi:hypothetical protein
MRLYLSSFRLDHHADRLPGLVGDSRSRLSGAVPARARRTIFASRFTNTGLSEST